MKATFSIYLLTLDIRTTIGLFAIRGDRLVGWEYFMAPRAKVEQTLAKENLKKEEEQNRKLQPQGEYELFEVDHDHL